MDLRPAAIRAWGVGDPGGSSRCVASLLRPEGTELANVADYGISEPRFASCFGFTEPEVVHLMEAAGAPDRLDIVGSWYDGYRFGEGVTIYNP